MLDQCGCPSPQELRDRGIDHVKIKCPGQTIPPDSVYKQYALSMAMTVSSRVLF